MRPILVAGARRLGGRPPETTSMRSMTVPSGLPRTRAGVGGPLRRVLAAMLLLGGMVCGTAWAGGQQYEPMTAAVRSALASAVSSGAEQPEPRFASLREKVDWLAVMSSRLPRKWKPEFAQRLEFLNAVRYEAQRAGLDPHLVLGLIEVESYFRRYAVSSAGARGYMQVMPFWTRVIGDGDPAMLFDMRTNLRYGCAILRHYIDLERGDLFRALGRYNGSLGRPEYPTAVLRAWRKWDYREAPPATTAEPVIPSGAAQRSPA